MIMPAETISRKLFTVDEYHRMSDIGIFPEDKRFELIRGEIYEMPTKIKGPLYAESGIPEYWIVNIPQNVLEVRSDVVNGRYMRHEILKHGQTVSPRLLPGVSFQVDEILG